MPIGSNSFRSMSDYFAHRSPVGVFVMNPIGFVIFIAIILIIIYYLTPDFTLNFFIASGLSLLALILFRDSVIGAKSSNQLGAGIVDTANSSISLKPRLGQQPNFAPQSTTSANLTGNPDDLAKLN